MIPEDCLQALRHLAHTVQSAMRQFWTGLVTDRPDRYQPERYYMRGPGPKWREKHGLGRARG
jgi:hypothetical protein